MRRSLTIATMATVALIACGDDFTMGQRGELLWWRHDVMRFSVVIIPLATAVGLFGCDEHRVP